MAALWRFLREENVSQTEIARRIGMTRSAVSLAFTKGSASVNILDKLTREINLLAEERSRPERFGYLDFMGMIKTPEDRKGSTPNL